MSNPGRISIKQKTLAILSLVIIVISVIAIAITFYYYQFYSDASKTNGEVSIPITTTLVPTTAAPTPPTTAITTSTPTTTTSSPTQTTTPSPVPTTTITSPTAAVTTSETPQYSIPSTPPTSPNPTKIAAVPIVATDEETESTVEVDKDKLVADNKDEITIVVNLNDKQGNPVTIAEPQIAVTGSGNTVSEVKTGKKSGQYEVSLKTDKPENKEIKVTAGNIKFPEIKITGIAKATSIELEEGPTPWYKTWWFWPLILLVLAGILYILYRMRRRLHGQEKEKMIKNKYN